jgi:hypothetical protein
LKKGLYGTHQGGRLWFHRYKQELVEALGFTQCHYDPSICMRRVDGKMIYVHDPSKEDAMKLDQFLRYMARRLDDPYVIQQTTREPTTDSHIVIGG